MSSELKVDTISEKTTASGVTIDGVLIKDNEIASSYISGLTVGLKGSQTFVLTADITSTGAADITSNIAAPTGTLQTNDGTLVSESSGIFSFSETGYYLIILDVTNNFTADNAYAPILIASTNDNFSSEDTIAQYSARHKSSVEVTGSISVIVKITSTTNDKIKFKTDITTNGIVVGSANENKTCFTFLKVGEV